MRSQSRRVSVSSSSPAGIGSSFFGTALFILCARIASVCCLVMSRVSRGWVLRLFAAPLPGCLAASVVPSPWPGRMTQPPSSTSGLTRTHSKTTRVLAVNRSKAERLRRARREHTKGASRRHN